MPSPETPFTQPESVLMTLTDITELCKSEGLAHEMALCIVALMHIRLEKGSWCATGCPRCQPRCVATKTLDQLQWIGRYRNDT